MNVDINTTANSAPTEWELSEIDPISNAVLSSITTQVGGIAFSYSHSVDNTTLRKFKIEADFGGEIKYKTFTILAHNPINIQSRPAWTKLGINYHNTDPTKATLVLHAPTYTVYKDGNGNQTGTNTTEAKTVIYVVGDFNNWQISES